MVTESGMVRHGSVTLERLVDVVVTSALQNIGWVRPGLWLPCRNPDKCLLAHIDIRSTKLMMVTSTNERTSIVISARRVARLCGDGDAGLDKLRSSMPQAS